MSESRGRPSIDNSQTTILIIDDETAIRLSYADHLADSGYQTLTAENGRVGLELVEQEKVDLILVDLRMPEVDGFEVLARVKEKSPEMPMIVVSGTGVIGDAVEALHQGAWDYLLKPIKDLAELNHSVANALEKAQLKRENLKYQQHLERMVAEQTNELIKANEHLSQINTRLTGIVDSTRSLSFCTDVDKFGSMLMREFGQHMMATGGSLYAKGEDGLTLIHTLDPNHAPQFIPFPLAEGSVFQRVLSQKQPILLQDINDKTDLTKSGWSGYKDGSSLIFPLPDESGNITGLLTLHSKRVPPFVEQDKKIGMILASYSSEALRAVRISEDLQATLEKQKKTIKQLRQAEDEIRLLNTQLEMRVESRTQELQHSLETLRKTQQQLIVQEKLASLGTLTAGIAHEMRNPLNFVVNFSQISKEISEKIKQNLKSKREHFKSQEWEKLESNFKTLIQSNNKVEEHGNRIGKVIESMLNHARSVKHDNTYTEINKIIEESLYLFSYSLKSKNFGKTPITISKNLAENLKKAPLSSQNIGRVFINIFNNAYDALNEKANTLGSDFEARILVATKDLGDQIEVRINDNGIGIPEEKHKVIFDPFYTSKPPGKGTGLGLSLSHDIIVMEHSGSLSVNSEEGEFTEFIITLPY